MKVFREPIEFEWDEGNAEKPKRHGVSTQETEEVFFDENKVIFADWKHSSGEPRITLLGKTKKGRVLNITYTIRVTKIRVITARPINSKEMPLYKQSLYRIYEKAA